MGDYLNNKKHGKGTMYYPNGNMTLGYYANGKPIGKHATMILLEMYLLYFANLFY